MSGASAPAAFPDIAVHCCILVPCVAPGFYRGPPKSVTSGYRAGRTKRRNL